MDLGHIFERMCIQVDGLLLNFWLFFREWLSKDFRVERMSGLCNYYNFFLYFGLCRFSAAAISNILLFENKKINKNVWHRGGRSNEFAVYFEIVDVVLKLNFILNLLCFIERSSVYCICIWHVLCNCVIFSAIFILKYCLFCMKSISIIEAGLWNQKKSQEFCEMSSYHFIKASLTS